MTKRLITKIIITFIIFFLYLFTRIELKSLEWIKYEHNPVLGNDKTGTIFDPFVIKHNNIYQMYISWRPIGAIALSTSIDGINWSEPKIVLEKGNEQSWESIVNRACIIIYNKKFYLWYTGQHNGKSKIGIAISENGNEFIKYKNNPILVPEKDFEKDSIMNPYVIYDENEKIFKMWYSAGEVIEPDVICYATSKNGINWIKYQKNPIFTPNPNKLSFDSFKVGGCEVHKISKNKYLMFYIGYSDINTARIFVAKSNNGINKWERSDSPIIKPTKEQFDSDACYKPSVLYDKKKKIWMIWYNGRTKNVEFIGYAYNKNFHLF